MKRLGTVYVPSYAVRERLFREGRGAGMPAFIVGQVGFEMRRPK